MADQASDSVDQAQSQAQDAASDQGAQQQQGDVATRTFSQDDVDRIVKDRVARAKATPPADYEDLKAAKARLDELEAASATELEKAQKRTAELERQAADASARAQDALLRSAVVAEAARKNVVDPDAAFALIDRASLEFDDDGSPTNIADAMDSLLKAKPYLVGGGRSGGSADLGARGGTDAKQLTREQLKTMSDAEIVKAHEEGRLSKVAEGD